jgi:hypothetical protein
MKSIIVWNAVVNVGYFRVDGIEVMAKILLSNDDLLQRQRKAVKGDGRRRGHGNESTNVSRKNIKRCTENNEKDTP